MKVKYEKLTANDLIKVNKFEIENKKKALRIIRQPYIEAYNIVMNNHRNKARESDVLTDSELLEIAKWFNDLRDVTDTLDISVFAKTPVKVMKHFKG